MAASLGTRRWWSLLLLFGILFVQPGIITCAVTVVDSIPVTNPTSDSTVFCESCNLIKTSVSSTVSDHSTEKSVSEILLGIQQKKREISDKLPIESLFPSVDTKPKVASNITQEQLKSTLLNQTLHLHEMDKDLDNLVFSQLPQGSKLILRTVKIVRTDGNGNDEDTGEEATEWNVLLKNETGEGDIFSVPETFYTTNEDLSFEPVENLNGSSSEVSDLLGAATHQGSPTHYSSARGSHRHSKDKETKHYNNHDQGKHNKKTVTDTDDKSVTNYKGKEAGLTDFAKSQGDSQSKEGGRYKDSKKKNKGRKVTGFKRVYHKEEFQRTEHFYDDEEAKRIAESFGANDQNEKSSHGLKNDDRKYHGTHKEHTDGKKVQDEHGTKNSFDKGTHHAQKHAEHHDRHQDHATRHTGYPRQHHHDAGHAYHGSSSTDAKKVAPSPVSNATIQDEDALAESNVPDLVHSSTTSPVSSFLPTEILEEHPPDSPTGNVLRKPSSERIRGRPHTSRPRNRSRSKKDDESPNLAMTAPPLDAKPTEMKVFFSPRERHFPFSTSDGSMAYAPNFGPAHTNSEAQTPKYRPLKISITSKPPSRRPPPPRNLGYSAHTVEHPMSHSHETQHIHPYAKNPYSPPRFIHSERGIMPPHHDEDAIPPSYSTLSKTLPKRRPDPYNPLSNSPPGNNLVSVAKATSHEVNPEITILPQSSQQVPSSTIKSAPTIDPGSSASPYAFHTSERDSGPSPEQHMRQQIGWIPLGQPQSHSHNNIEHFHPNHPPTNKFPFNLNPFRLGKTLIPNMFHRPNYRSHQSPPPPNYSYGIKPQRPQAQATSNSATYRPARPAPSATPAYYVGPGSQTLASSTIPYNAKRNSPAPPPYNTFVNGLMDSVAGFFSTRVGK